MQSQKATQKADRTHKKTPPVGYFPCRSAHFFEIKLNQSAISYSILFSEHQSAIFLTMNFSENSSSPSLSSG